MTVKLIITGRRPPGITRAAMSEHMRDVHGRMVLMPPADAGRMPCGYVQNPVIDGSYPDAANPAAIDRDFVTELWFETEAALGEAVRTAYYLTRLQPDESNFVSQPSVLRGVVDEAMIVARDLPASHKAFLFWRLAGTDIAGFHAAWQSAQQAALQSPAAATVSRWVGNVVRSSPSRQPAFAGVDEIWFSGSHAAASIVFDTLLHGLEGVASRQDSFFVIAEEFTSERLLAAYRTE